jgi:hypothetical protein
VNKPPSAYVETDDLNGWAVAACFIYCFGLLYASCMLMILGYLHFGSAQPIGLPCAAIVKDGLLKHADDRIFIVEGGNEFLIAQKVISRRRYGIPQYQEIGPYTELLNIADGSKVHAEICNAKVVDGQEIFKVLQTTLDENGTQTKLTMLTNGLLWLMMAIGAKAYIKFIKSRNLDEKQPAQIS